jgi:hypothetical protein
MCIYSLMFDVLFLTGLSYGTDDHSLKEAFDNFGNVTEGTALLPYIFCICWLQLHIHQ